MERRDYLIIPVLLAGLFYLLHLGKSLLIPLVIAVFIWYLINALAQSLSRISLGPRRRVPYFLAFSGALLIITLILYLFSGIIAGNVSKVAAAAPAYQQNLEALARRGIAILPDREPLRLESFSGLLNLGAMARSLAVELTNFLGQWALVMLYLAFLFLEQRSFGDKLLALAGGRDREKLVRSIIAKIDRDIRAYLGIKTLTSLATSLLCYLIFSAVGLDFASFWAFMVFLLNYIPTIGSIIATALPSLLALVQFGTPGPVLAVVLGVTAVQQVIGSLIEPRLMGDQLNLSPLVILLSLGLWGRLWGISGMFLCVPITAIAMIIFSHFPRTRPLALALSRNGRLGAG
jgi:predicted PurR-regulated permease PerM